MNTALNRTLVAVLTNKSGGALVQGDVVIIDSSTASSFTTTTTSGFVNGQVGVIIEPNGIANNASGLVAFGGYVPKVNLSGSASLGDVFKTHTVAGQAVRHAAPLVVGDFGIVLATGTTPAAMLFGFVNQGGGAPSGSAGGDLAGTYPNPTVAQSSTAFALTGDISPSQITSNQNDYNPTGLSGASVLRLSSDASRNITGLQGGADGRIIVIVNVGSNNIVLKDTDGGSSASNQFALSGDITLAADDGVILQYDSTSSRWRCVGKSPGGSSGAPSDADYWVETANGSLSAEVVVGTTGITTAAEASAQAAAKAGRLFFPNDGYWVKRDTGSAWVPWGPLFPLTDPAISAPTTWINQGGATVTTTQGGIFLSAPAGAGNNIRARRKTAPSTPYTITVGFIPQIVNSASMNCGIGWYDGTKFVLFRPVYDGTLAVAKMNSVTSFNSNYSAFGVCHYASSMWWLQIKEDSANRTCLYSADGINFLQLHQVSRTDFLTATDVCFFAESNNASIGCGILILSWKEA